jgi:hypothetical protein
MYQAIPDRNELILTFKWKILKEYNLLLISNYEMSANENGTHNNYGQENKQNNFKMYPHTYTNGNFNSNL